jgi:hypothetical protein
MVVYLLSSMPYQICDCGVFSTCACRVATCIEPTLGDHGGEHGKESEEGKESKEDSQEEKEVTVRENLRTSGQHLNSDTSLAARTGGSSCRPRNEQSGRTFMHITAA